MRRNVRFLRVLDELCEPKYTAQNKAQFVDSLRHCMMLDPKKVPPRWLILTLLLTLNPKP